MHKLQAGTKQTRIKKVWGQGAFPKKALVGSRADGPGRARRREIPSRLNG